MKKILFVLLLIIISVPSYSQHQKYQKVKIWFDGKNSSQLAGLGVDLLEGEYKRGTWFVSDFSESEVERINQGGFRTEILIDDVQKFYRERAQRSEPSQQRISAAGCSTGGPEYTTPSHFYLGEMGGYFSYDQMIDIIDSMALLYPSLITVKQQIDPTLTIEGNPIYYVKISDNATVDETEPEILYTAVHHAREAESLSQLIYYMWYLLENYSSDQKIQYLVDNTEMFFVPCLNPDGYMYNQMTDPNGGGMWRKNRRNNLDGEFGVDLNRNYDYFWGFDDTGSSPFTADETYRGTAPFSEPETQAISNFTAAHEFKYALNYHTYGNHLVQPFGYIPDLYPADSAQYSIYGNALTAENRYHVGPPNQTVNYVVNGNSDDWMYGEQVVKPKIYAWTPEVGLQTDGFWPAPDRIIPLANDNIYANLMLPKLATKYGKVTHNVDLNIGQLGNYFVFDFNVLGENTGGFFTVSLFPVSANIISTGAPRLLSPSFPLQVIADSISFNLDPTISNGDQIIYIVACDNGTYTEVDTIVQTYGIPQPLILDDCSTMANWSAGTNWNTTTEDFVSASTSITDSPFSDYLSNDFNEIILANNVDLSGVVNASLSFDAKWVTEKGFDYVQLSASADNGASWTPLCGRYTQPSTEGSIFGEPSYEGTQFDWVRETVSLNDYIGQNIKIRFRLVSDGFVEFDGFYFDDISIETLSPNTGVTATPLSIFISQAYPNPAAEKATVNYHLANAGDRFVVYNSFGQLMFEKEITATNGTIEISTVDFSSGMYTYCILQKAGGRSKVGKFLVSE